MRFNLLIISLILIVQSCSLTKQVPDNHSLLIENDIVIHSKENQNLLITKSEIDAIIKQKPNKKIFGFVPFHLGIYNLSDTLNTKWIHRYLRRIGEKPIILNTQLIKQSEIQIKRLLAQKGYFDSTIQNSIITKDRKSKVTYNLFLGNIYTINNINYPTFKQEKTNQKITDSKNSLINKGHILNADKLDEERNRITEILQNSGYFNFKRENIYFDVDTAFNNNTTNISIQIDTTDTIANKQYVFDEVIILIESEGLKSDTIIWEEMTFINSKEIIKEKILKKAIEIKKGELYSKLKISDTRKNLSNLNIFKSINIEIKENLNTEKKSISCIIYLQPQTKMYYTLETEGTHSSGNLGASLNFKFGNKNTFKGAENFNFKFKGALETINSLTEDESFFNTWELGGETSLETPRLLVPNQIQKRIKKILYPKTRFSLSLTNQQRPDFKRLILKTTLFGYNFKSKKNRSHFVNLAEISYVSILDQNENFSTYINTSPFLTYQYTNHLISASSYTFIFNNQEINKLQNYSFLKFRIETSGFNLNNLARIINFQKDYIEDYEFYTLLGNRFTQYIKGELDFRKYFVVNKENAFAFRFYSGIAYPYGNSRQMPPQKQFFSGGTNGIRAWNPFSLGPGSYKSLENENYFLGDIKLETNIEYRFPLFNIGSYKMKGALFLDAGNIWLINEVDDYEVNNSNGGVFTNEFINEIAIGTGFGIRYDVNFVIFRIDLGIPLKNPYLNDNNSRWIKDPIKNAINGNVVLNLGIGYPF
mgnify:CR=1 FL=1